MAKPHARRAAPVLKSAVDSIVTKRDGGELTREEIVGLIAGFMQGRVADYQLSAWLMAVLFRGMSLDETVALTQAMLHSGETLRHPSVAAPKVDKHSTGGVGDKISLCLAPLVACCGVAVPMISGRGLGHTGGTLDKLEAIEGYQTRLSAARFTRIVRQVGVSIMGQTETLAPADRRIYALRDVTGTVPSIPLIVSSILSKKLAAGLDALVLDVKVGAGAFMRDRRAARELARTLTAVGERLGLPVRALLTDMSTPIGRTIGNSLETREAIEVLLGGGPSDTVELTLALGAQMLCAAGVASDADSAYERLERVLESGAGAEKLERMIRLHGGDGRVAFDPSRLPRAPVQLRVPAPRAGYVAELDALALGKLAVVLGAGRTRADQAIDPRVGIELHTERGAWVEAREPLCTLHVKDRAGATELRAAALAAFEFANEKPKARPRVIGRVGDKT